MENIFIILDTEKRNGHMFSFYMLKLRREIIYKPFEPFQILSRN